MPLLEELLLGLYIGTLTGVFSAVIVYGLTFTFTYFAGAKLSINYALLIGLGIAGLAGGPRLLLRSPEILQSSTSLVMLMVVLLLSFYAHGRATDLGNAVPPRSVVLGRLRPRSLSADAITHIGRYGQVRVHPTGEVGDLEGYPPVGDETRLAIRGDSWWYPADLPLGELERRLEERLRSDYDLADADVSIDSTGRASIRVAPTLGGLSRRVPQGAQVVTVKGVLPSGVATGDDVLLKLSTGSVEGRVVAVAEEGSGPLGDDEPDEDADEEPSTEDGAGLSSNVDRLAVAIERSAVGAVVGHDLETVAVRSRGQLPVFEFVSRLRRDKLRFRKVTVGEEGDLVGRALDDLKEAEMHGVVVLAMKGDDRWRFAPGGSVSLSTGDELYVAGPAESLDAFREVAA